MSSRMNSLFCLATAFFFSFLFLVLPADSCAAKIYKYKNKDGTWSFTNDPSIVPDLTRAEERDSIDTKTINNLREKLLGTFPPKNKVEEARNASVAIKTSVGMGSGFFITEDGYILTNKHVLKGDQGKLQKLEKVLNEAKTQLQKESEAISRERERLQKLKALFESQGKRTPADLRSLYLIDKRNLESYIARHEKRKKTFEKKSQDVDDLKRKMQNPYDNQIVLIDKSELDVSLVSMSYQYDLALLRLYGYKCPFLEPASPRLEYGAPLYAIGSPLQLMYSVTSGIFSGVREFKRKRYIQTNAQINPGNSGGPLITKEGRVVGINTFKLVGPGIEGVGFAIPIDVALKEFERYLGKLSRFD